MDVVRPEFLPAPDLDRADMEAMQRELASAARFEDDPAIDPGDVDAQLVAGIDQAFLDDRAVSAIVAMRGEEVIERTAVVSSLSIPYVPGLLAFREGGPIVAAARDLDCEPDLLLFDGSGRIHYRQAGLATHLGVVFDVPSIGVAKNLLCGTPRRSLDGLAVGYDVAIEADSEVDAPDGTIIGHAVQTRQFDSQTRRINPLFVSPGHRVAVDSAPALVEAACTSYKLPEPIRRADGYAAERKAAATE